MIEYIGNESLKYENDAIIKYPIQHGIITNWDDMEKIFNYCFYQDLGINMEAHPCLITENTINNK